MRRVERVGVVTVAVLAAAVPALADPPTNDRRSDAQPLTVRATVNGTTREATRQSNDPGSQCAISAGTTVWYSIEPSRSQRIAIELTARTDDLEATIDVFRRDRSRLEPLDCDVTNRRGRASVVFSAAAGERYLVMVDQVFDSEPGDFRLETFVPEPEPTPPGPPLPRRGGVATVDRARDLTDAWSKRLRAGTSYVATLASRSEACPTFGIYEPGLSSFDEAGPLRVARCNAHRLFTPERSGRYSFLVRAGRGEQGPQRYRMRVRRASRDDTAPGNVIRNYERVRGHVGPRRADVVDLHRFYVTRRSDVTLRFAPGGDLTLELRNVRGRLLATSGGDLRAVLRRGRYYATVRSGDSGGRYTLRPAVRTITRAFISINGRREAVISPGQAARVAVAVAPAVRGRITILVERLDPLEGWQFHRRFVSRTSVGRATASFVPRRPGRFRARADYAGSRLAAPSATGYAYVSARERF
jgi:hypothetical protein